MKLSNSGKFPSCAAGAHRGQYSRLLRRYFRILPYKTALSAGNGRHTENALEPAHTSAAIHVAQMIPRAVITPRLRSIGKLSPAMAGVVNTRICRKRVGNCRDSRMERARQSGPLSCVARNKATTLTQK